MWDAPTDMLSTERSVNAVREFVRQVVSVKNKKGEHVIPIIIGGDHSLIYPDAAGLADIYGLTPRATFPLIRRLCAESNVVGFELVELLPYREDGYTSVLNSERIVRECLVGITLRKKVSMYNIIWRQTPWMTAASNGFISIVGAAHGSDI